MTPQAPLGSRPTALILSGGAAFGSWQAGCMYGLVKKGMRFHSVFGTSIGALNGCAYFQDTLELSWKVWRDVDVGNFFRISPRLNPLSLLSGPHLRDYLGYYVDEDRAKRLRRCWFYVISSDIASGRTHMATYSPDENGPWEGPLLENVLGSISIPFVLPPVRLEEKSGRHKLLLDGNTKSFINLFPAIERGIQDIIYVNVVHPSEMASPVFSMRGYISTMINQLLQGQIDHSLDAIRNVAAAQGIRAYVFHPSEPLRLRPLYFDKEPCRNAFDLGLEDAGKLINDPAPYRVL